MQNSIDKSWMDWIALNLSRGCDKHEVVQILLDQPFAPISIIEAVKKLPDAQMLINIVHEKLRLQHQVKVLNTNEQFLQDVENARLIDSIKLPFALKAKTEKANFYLIENFLNSSECEMLISLIKNRCKPSTLTNPDEHDDAFRTSQTCDLGLLKDNALVQVIDQRISAYMGFEVERSESIQGQYYQVGQQFKTHTDYFEPNTSEYTKFAGDLGQRTWTFMIYLNAVALGGETNFPEIGIEITPFVGRAVVWNSLLPNGDVNPATAHCAKPVRIGEKLVITKWFRTYGRLKEIYQIPSFKNIPLFTRHGFTKLSIPKDLFIRLQAFYHAQKPYEVAEKSDAIGTYIQSTLTSSPATMIALTEALRAIILKSITPLLEAWVSIKLEPSTVYGIREYQKGATLSMHVDRIETHQVSAILNIAQHVNTDWPLHIQDHMGKLHEIIMMPGEMLFYESARLKHGRTKPLDGVYFANIFTHTRPVKQ